MLQLNLSKNLEKDMAAHLQPVAVAALHPQQWYLQKITVLRRKCIVAMEEKSRYAMVFCGLTRAEFTNFPELFRERLWRESMAVCQLDDADNVRLSDLVLNNSQLQSYQVGSDRSVQAHLRDAIWRFRWHADEVGRLPEGAEEHFVAGLRINDTIRTIRGSKSWISPLEEFRAGWLRRLGIAAP
jgi:hypothetical protein